MSLAQGILLFFLSGFASLDRVAGINIMLSRPIVITSIIGIAFNQILICILIGAIFEFIGMLEVPVGTVILKDDTFAGYSSSVLISLGAISHNNLSILLAIILVTLMIYPVTLTDIYCRKLNKLMITRAFNETKSNTNSDGFLIRIGLLVSFIRGVVVYNLATFLIFLTLHNIGYFAKQEVSPIYYLVLLFILLMGCLFRFLNGELFMKLIFLVIGFIASWIIL